MIELLFTAIGLGIAGIDPVGALIAIGALSSGARDRAVLAFGLIVIVCTNALGTVLSLTVGVRLATVDWSFLDGGYRFWALGEAIAGTLLVVWAWRRIRSVSDGVEPKKRRSSEKALLIAGVLFAFGAILDPTFVATIVLAGRDGNWLDASLGHLIWILCSQSPLVIVMGAILTRKHESVVAKFQTWWDRSRPVVALITTRLALAIGAVLLLDAGFWFVRGEFLLDFS